MAIASHRTEPLTRARASIGAASAAVALGIGLYAIHAHEYRGWLVDDAGISIAYAEHLAAGQGLVSQPGLPPVEGYSNPLWVFVLALASRGGLLALPATPKLIAAVFVAGVYTLVVAIVRRAAVRAGLASALAVALCSLNPSWVIWCTSGLENALYALGVVGLAYATLRALDAADRGGVGRRPFVLAGGVAALVAMTRPEGVLYAAVPPLLAWGEGRRDRRLLAAYGGAVAAVFGAFLASRLAVFHQLLPNTALAKGGPSAGDVVDLLLFTSGGVAKADALLEGAVPWPLGNVAAAGAVAMAWSLARRPGGLGRPLRVLLAFTVAAFADFMLLPPDWAPETRFGTSFVPLYYASLLALLDRALESPRIRPRRAALCAVVGAALCLGAPDFARRVAAFATAPTIDLFYVRRAFAERFDRYAAALQVDRGSVLLPDVGGMLLWSHLRVYDLGGLCDPSVAALRSRDEARLREVVFGAMRPTFIHTYGKFSRTVDLELDPRFATDYVAIHAYDDAEDRDRQRSVSGIFVRRDAIVSDEARAALQEIRREPHARRTFNERHEPSALVRWLARL